MGVKIKREAADEGRHQDEDIAQFRAELDETKSDMVAFMPHIEGHDGATDGKPEVKREHTDDGYKAGATSPKEEPAQDVVDGSQGPGSDSQTSQSTQGDSNPPGGIDVCGPSQGHGNLTGPTSPFISRPVFAFESPTHRYMLRPSISLRQPDRYNPAGYQTSDDNRNNAIHGALTVLANVVPGADITDDPTEVLEITRDYIRRNWCTCNR